MTCSCIAATAMLFVGFAFFSTASQADLEYIDPVSDLTGSCFLQGIALTATPPNGVTELDAEGATLYGAISLGGGSFPVALNLCPEGAFLYVDPHQKGVYEEAAWAGVLPDGKLLARIAVNVFYEETESRIYRLFVLWSPQFPIVLAYCRGAYYGGLITLDGATYRLAILDEDTDGRYDDLESGTLFIDVDQDGALLTTIDSHEEYGLDEPFNIGGTVYRVVAVAADGSQVKIEKSDEWVEEKLPLEVGFPAPMFVALESLRGKIVLLDFWASWCAPCIAEFPTIKGIATRFPNSEVAVLGINLDSNRTSFEQAQGDYGLTYPQIYDGEKRAIASLYRIAGVPMTYVIDPDGIIRGKRLKATALIETIESLLNKDD